MIDDIQPVTEKELEELMNSIAFARKLTGLYGKNHD